MVLGVIGIGLIDPNHHKTDEKFSEEREESAAGHLHLVDEAVHSKNNRDLLGLLGINRSTSSKARG
jgi:hypothetical protein